MERTRLLKRLDSVLGPAICSLLSRLVQILTRLHPEPVIGDPPAGARILVIRPGGIGDMILLIPAIRDLETAYPGIPIDILCETRNTEVLNLAGLNNRALLYDAQPIRCILRIVWRRYWLCIDSEQFHNFSAVFSLLSAARTRIGFKVTPRRNPIYTHAVPYDLHGAEISQFRALLKPLGLDQDSIPETPWIEADATVLEPEIETRLRAMHDRHRTLIAVCPSERSAYKAWPIDRYAQSIRQIAADQGAGILLLGDRRDVVTCARLRSMCELADDAIYDVAGKLSLAATAAALSTCGGFMGNDTGVAHLAAALGLPVVTIYGPSDRRKWFTPGPNRSALQRPLPCSPCFVFGTQRPCDHQQCLNEIEVEEVIEALHGVMAPAYSGRRQ